MIILNERERAEFERHKKLAEEQINKMYYGSSQRQPKTNAPLPPLRTSSVNSKNNSQKSTEKENVIKQKKEEPHTIHQSPNHILRLLNFKNLKIDNDRLIIIAICLLLSGEEVDELLMLALIYIML